MRKLWNRPSNVHRPTRSLAFESLESRRVLALVISSDTTWSSDTTLTDDVTIPAGVTLTINPGVTVNTANSAYDFTVNGTLSASNVEFIGPTQIEVNGGGALNMTDGTTASGNFIDLDPGSTGTIANSDLAALTLYNEGGANVFSNSLGDVHTNPSLVGELYDNAFAPESIVYLFGTANNDAALAAIPNVSRYALSGDVAIAAGVTLIVNPSVQVDTANSAYDITVNGTLSAAAADFTGPTQIEVNSSGSLNLLGGTTVSGNFIDLDPGSDGTIASSDLAGVTLYNEGGATLTANTLSNVHVNPSLVGELYDNAFAPGSVVSLFGTANNDATLSTIPNVLRYALSGDLAVAAGVTLSAEPGVQLDSANSAYDITVNGTLAASNADFTGPTQIEVKESGTLDLTNGTTVSGNFIDLDPGSDGTLANSDLAGITLINEGGAELFSNTLGNVRTNPSLVGELYDNAFVPGSLVYLFGTANNDATLNAIPNVPRYALSGDLTVAAGVALNFSPGVQLDSANTAYDIVVNGTLSASNAEFTGPTQIEVTDSGALYLTNGSTVSGSELDLRAGSAGAIANSTVDVSLMRIEATSTASVHGNNLLSPDVQAYGDSSATIDLTGNYWGTTSVAAISGKIDDHNDSTSRPTIDFQPFLSQMVAPPTSPAPTAAISVGNVTAEGGASHTLTVTYMDNTQIDVSTIDGGDVVVIAPDATEIPVQLIGVSSAVDASPVTATYRMPAPGLQWDPADNGVYVVQVRPDAVFDVDAVGNTAQSSAFTVAIPELIAPILRVDAVTSTSVTLSWTDAGIEAGYHVFETSDQVPRIQLPANTNSTTISGLTPGRNYEFYVRAYTTAFVQAANSNFEQATTPVAANADFDNSHRVDGGDFLAWQRGYGKPGASLATGDANANGQVDGQDLAIWQSQFGSTTAAAAATQHVAAANSAAVHSVIDPTADSPLDASLIDIAMQQEAQADFLAQGDEELASGRETPFAAPLRPVVGARAAAAAETVDRALPSFAPSRRDSAAVQDDALVDLESNLRGIGRPQWRLIRR